MDYDIPSDKMNIHEKLKRVLTEPSNFFDSIKYETGLEGPFKFLAFFSIFYVLGDGILSFFFYKDITNLDILFLTIAMKYLQLLILTFVSAGIMHLFAILFKGQGKYEDTYKSLVYGSAPILLFGWIPLFAIIPGIYSLYLEIKGISKLHDVSMGRSAAIVVTPIIIVLFLTVILPVIAYLYISQMFNSISAGLDVVNSQCVDGTASWTIRNMGSSDISASTITITSLDENCNNDPVSVSISAQQIETFTAEACESGIHSYRVIGPSNGVTLTVTCP